MWVCVLERWLGATEERSRPEHNSSSGLPIPIPEEGGCFGAGRGLNSWCRLSRRGQGRAMGSLMGRGRSKDGVGISVQGGKRKEYIPKQNSFVPTSSASHSPDAVLNRGMRGRLRPSPK